MTSNPDRNDRPPSRSGGYAEPDRHDGATAATPGQDEDHGRHRDPDATAARREDARAVVERERQEYGGVHVGAAFFGWLTAVGMFVLLAALLSAAGAAIGLSQTEGSVTDAADDAAEAVAGAGDVGTIGVVSAVVVLLLLFLAYLAGGYVAGRMARFDGLKQGAAVWVWAVVVAVVLAVLGALAGSRFDVLATTGAFPRIPVNEGDLTTAGIVAAVVALLVSLAGALLGGRMGEHYHRKVDEVGIDLR